MVSVVEDELLRVEIEREGMDETFALEMPIHSDMIAEIRERLALDPEVHVFERDQDEPLTCNVEKRRHLRLLAHPQRSLEVVVRYDHLEKDRRFPPSATVFRVLRWAVGKQAYNLDPNTAAKANLMLPGAEQPLPRDRTIGSFTRPGSPRLVLDLTLKDFTNG